MTYESHYWSGTGAYCGLDGSPSPDGSSPLIDDIPRGRKLSSPEIHAGRPCTSQIWCLVPHSWSCGMCPYGPPEAGGDVGSTSVWLSVLSSVAFRYAIAESAHRATDLPHSSGCRWLEVWAASQESLMKFKPVLDGHALLNSCKRRTDTRQLWGRRRNENSMDTAARRRSTEICISSQITVGIGAAEAAG